MSLLLNTDASCALPGWAMETCLRLEPGAAASSAQVLALLISRSSEVPGTHNCFHSFRKDSILVSSVLLMPQWHLHMSGRYEAASHTHALLHLKPPPEAANRFLHLSVGYSQLAMNKSITTRCTAWKASTSTDRNTKGRLVTVALGLRQEGSCCSVIWATP